MCGIFGYVGKKNNASQITLEGLKLLEYRGYDSWGIATKINDKSVRQAQDKKSKIKNKFIVEKHVGKIGNATLNFQLSTFNSQLAIGHTRWATHGGVIQANAHPHLDCTRTIAVVHNGIVENFEELKKDLIKKGHKFVSETDTEVIPHLIEEYLKKKARPSSLRSDVSGRGFASSVRYAFNQLKGLNAVVVASAKSSEIIAAKTGSPLVVGIGESELYVASDAAGIVKHTKKVLFIEDNQMVILGKTLKLLALPKGNELKAEYDKLTWTFEESDRGKFKHFILKEIYEQPKVIENIALNYYKEIEALAGIIEKAIGTFVLGCGTASYAALAGTYLFSRIAKKHINFSIGSEFKYMEDYLTPESLVIAISQSGETIDVVEPVGKAKNKGSKIAAIVNVLGSTLYRQADYKILLGAGPEKAVVGTKSFIAMVSILLLTAYAAVGKQVIARDLLIKSIESVKKILKDDYIKEIEKVAGILKNKEHIYIIGRGLSYATALEASLKIKETSYVHAEGFSGGELKHGVISLIDKGTPCIVIAPNDETFDDIISNAQEVKARNGLIIGIGPKKDNVFDYFLETQDVGDATIIPQVVISQLLGYHLALKKGIKDPDKPRNLAKSVTVK